MNSIKDLLKTKDFLGYDEQQAVIEEANRLRKALEEVWHVDYQLEGAAYESWSIADAALVYPQDIMAKIRSKELYELAFNMHADALLADLKRQERDNKAKYGDQHQIPGDWNYVDKSLKTV